MSDDGPESALPGDITRLLRAWSQGDAAARDQLMSAVYGDLHRRAAVYLRRERPGHTLDPAGLVHEAYLRLLEQEGVGWQNRAHFFASVSETMRHVLVDHARRRGAKKRGGDRTRVTLEDSLIGAEGRGVDLLALDEALTELARHGSQQARIVVLRFFGGLSIEETAEALDISPATVKRDWNLAKAWLHRRMKPKPRRGLSS